MTDRGDRGAPPGPPPGTPHSPPDAPALPAGDLPVSPRCGPYVVTVEAGRRYRWCSCGLSAIQPWCDDAHEGTGFEPIEFEAPISGEFHMCGCKQSDNKPYCFGTCRGHTPENTKLDLF